MNRLILALLALGPVLEAPGLARADLDAFVRRPDPTFSWKHMESRSLPEGRVHRLALTSQTWQGRPWTHALQIFEPADIKHPQLMLLFLTGGSNRDGQATFPNMGEGLELAKACGGRVAILPQVPNQPLLDGKVEDDLIAETLVRYLETKDEDWPLLQPMVKSAVRAMDAIQAWSKAEDRPVPARFVVSGASKRGWTTWLTAAVDDRVAAIAPLVIPTLNMKSQKEHQIASWGKYSEQIDDYVRRGLLAKMDEPAGETLWKLIDPYTYRDRLTMPKLQINGTNDPYWTLDSMNLYWNELKGPSFVAYLPNAKHDLGEHRDWAVNGVGALFRHVASGRAMPEIAGEFRMDGDRIAFSATASPRPSKPDIEGFQVWGASALERDFRKSEWNKLSFACKYDPEPFGVEGSTGLPSGLPLPNIAVFADFVFEIEGLEYHLTSPITILKKEVQPR